MALVSADIFRGERFLFRADQCFTVEETELIKVQSPVGTFKIRLPTTHPYSTNGPRMSTVEAHSYAQNLQRLSEWVMTNDAPRKREKRRQRITQLQEEAATISTRLTTIPEEQTLCTYIETSKLHELLSAAEDAYTPWRNKRPRHM